MGCSKRYRCGLQTSLQASTHWCTRGPRQSSVSKRKIGLFRFCDTTRSGDILVETEPTIRKILDLQADTDTVRDLCVKIEELSFGPDGPRAEISGPPNRLQRLLVVRSRVEVLWPTCSAKLRDLLESEYLAVRSITEETEREESIQSYLDAQRDDEYQ